MAPMILVTLVAYELSHAFDRLKGDDFSADFAISLIAERAPICLLQACSQYSIAAIFAVKLLEGHQVGAFVLQAELAKHDLSACNVFVATARK